MWVLSNSKKFGRPSLACRVLRDTRGKRGYDGGGEQVGGDVLESRGRAYSSIRLIGLTDWSRLRGANWSPVGSAQQNQSSVRPGR